MDSDDILKVVLVLAAVFVLIPALGAALALPMLFGFGHGGAMGFGGIGLLWWLVSGLLPILVLGGAGYLLYTALSGDGGTDPAIAELRAAYARGDLTDEEFEARYQRLRREESTDEEW